MNVVAWVKNLFGAAPQPLSLLRTHREGEALNPEEVDSLRKGLCPDCGAGLLAGPEGGMCQNVLCESDVCASKFNNTPFGVVRLTDANPKKTIEHKSTYRS